MRLLDFQKKYQTREDYARRLFEFRSLKDPFVLAVKSDFRRQQFKVVAGFSLRQIRTPKECGYQD